MACIESLMYIVNVRCKLQLIFLYGLESLQDVHCELVSDAA